MRASVDDRLPQGDPAPGTSTGAARIRAPRCARAGARGMAVAALANVYSRLDPCRLLRQSEVERGLGPHHQPLVTYLLLTCFDRLGQAPDWLASEHWLRSRRHAPERMLHPQHVVNFDSCDLTSAHTGFGLNVGDICGETAGRRLEAMVGRVVRGRRLPFECRVHVGGPLERIIDAARGADSIVMSTAGRTGIPRLLIGSVAERVVRHAPLPVLTVRPPVRGRPLRAARARAARRP